MGFRGRTGSSGNGSIPSWWLPSAAMYRGDPELHAYIDELGMLLARQSKYGDQRWTFTVLDTPAVNAFALPGGYVYLTRGLVALARNESELAAVLAHEIAHVVAHHGQGAPRAHCLGQRQAAGFRRRSSPGWLQEIRTAIRSRR